MRRLVRGLLPLTVANIKSFYRDRSSLFWTLAFPIIFVILFGSIFSGRAPNITIAWVDEDHSAASAQLRAAFEQVPIIHLKDEDETAALDEMRAGGLDGVLVIPTGLSAALQPGRTGPPFALTLYTDPSSATSSGTVMQIVQQVVGAMNLSIAGVPPLLAVEPHPLQTQSIGAAAYFVPSILAMALMQLGIFAAIPLVAQRVKFILKRLNATPLSRATLVSSNVLMRLLIALVQTVLILGIGAALFGVTIVGSIAVAAGLHRARRADVPRARLRDRLVRADRGVGQCADQRRPVPADVPVGHLLPDRVHARVAPAGRSGHAADLPRRRAATDDGRRRGLRAAASRRADAGRLVARRIPDLGPLFPLAMSDGRTGGQGHAYVGTSGFAYPDWAPLFYKSGTRGDQLLREYAARLPAVELNNTFYQQPRPEKVAAWLAATPDDFRFVVKAQRGGSMRAFGSAAEQTVGWLTGPYRAFGDRLGSVLYRVPEQIRRDDDEAGRAASRLARRHAPDRRIPALVLARRRGV